ncbi:DUF4012 domain-containing protein [Patescibacteria group bacterium]|nr:DUF4012 domain-containing protein [Patescibacteria group bacterium]
MSENTTATQDKMTHKEESILKKISFEESEEEIAQKEKFFQKHKKPLIIAGGILGIFLVIFTVLSLYTLGVINTFKTQGFEVKTTTQAAYTNFKNQNLPATEAELKKLEQQEQNLRQTYKKLSIYNYIPVLRKYYLDGIAAFNAGEAGLRAALKTVEAITPYADVLGFAGEDTFAGGTAEDRLKLVLQTIDKISPILDDITAELNIMQTELALINPNRYPEDFRGQNIRSYILTAQESGQTALSSIIQYRPILEQLPEIMGAKEERKKYLILFQNDNELRPTGGFLTAYATIFIEDGKVSPEKSDDIYELDKKFNKRIPIPEELGRYLTTEKYWNLRDMNTSPDFKISIKQFLEHYLEIRGEPKDINGVIAVDTEFLTKLLEVLGPVEVPGYGIFSAENDPRCDCPQVVYALSEIITKPTPYLRDDRKGILGPMMRAILTKSYGAPRQQWPQLFQIGVSSMEGRHLQMYFMDETAQSATEAINAAGVMNAKEGADFLAIVNANLGGAKSNLFTEYEVSQIVRAPENGQITKEIEITYRNTKKADNCNLEAGQLCLNSTLRDWTRLYLPAGSKLIEAQGFTEEAKEYEENGFHVIDGFFILEPLGQAKLKLSYTVPYADNQTYRLKLWKQGGIDPIKTLMDVTGGQEEIMVNKDILYETPF